MSAGTALASYHLAKPTADLYLLAPGFRAAVQAAIDECNNAANQLDAMVYETYRSDELQRVYYARGRTVRPPVKPVTNASTNLKSWHGYGLAVDVIHKTEGWEPKLHGWFFAVAGIFKRHDCKWGGDWTSPDLPHFQWGRCKPSPSDVARELIRTRGVEAVWEAVGALGDPDGALGPT
jgi:peptidoglycan L-alanyl-D-glutamate endopeptidase CwlK